MTDLEFLEKEKTKAYDEMMKAKNQNPLAYSSKRSYYAHVVDQIKKLEKKNEDDGT